MPTDSGYLSTPIYAVQVEAGAEPAWRQLYVQIKRHLESGVLETGDAIPAERDMAQQLGLSRGTIKRCYDQLRVEGLLAGRGRGGSVLQAPKSHRPVLGQLKGFTQEMRELGKVASTRLERFEILADRAMASLFQLNSQTQLCHLVRIRLADDIPMTRENAWYNLSLAPQLAKWNGEGSAYDFLQIECGIRFGQATQTLEAVTSNTQENAAFGFTTGQPCLLFKRKVFDHKARLIEYVEGCFRGDLYTYQMPLQV